MDIQSTADSRRRLASALWYWGPVVFYAGLIFYLSSQSHPEDYVPRFLFFHAGDKVLHAMEYAGLGFLCYRALRHAAGAWAKRYAVFLAVVTATVYGATDEWHQAFVPFRESDPWDLMTDCAGSLLGVVAWSWIETRLPDARRDAEASIVATDAPPLGRSAETGGFLRLTDND